MDATQTSSQVIGLEDQGIAKVYAQALYNAASAENQIDEVMGELGAIVHEVFPQQPQFEMFLASAAIDLEEKQRVLQHAFQHRVSHLSYNFLQVLASRDRLSLIRAVYLALIDLHNRKMRRIPVRVETAVPLSEDQKQRLVQQLREGFQLEPILEEITNPDVLGGIILQVADFVFDASVRGEIQKIHKHLKARSSYGIEQIRDRIFPNG